MVAMVTETWNGSSSYIVHKKCFESKLFNLCAFVLLIMELTKISEYYIIQRKMQLGRIVYIYWWQL